MLVGRQHRSARHSVDGQFYHEFYFKAGPFTSPGVHIEIADGTNMPPEGFGKLKGINPPPTQPID
jgi:hypothetical protein